MARVWAYRGELPDTAAFTCRRWVWVPTAGVGGDGILTLSQRPLKSNDLDLDTYGVEEVMPEYPGCRSFAVVNLTDPDQEQPYRCTVGAVPRCSCDAGRKGFRRTSCKHRDGLTAVLAAGLLPARRIEGV